jgi:hypothetical protein
VWRGLLLAVALMGCAQAADAQPAIDLRGRVIDSITGGPVANAIVRLPASGKYTLSHDDGFFVITGVAPGRHTVVVVQLGYAEMVQDLDVRSDAFHELRIAPQPIVLDEIGATATRAVERMLNSAASRRAITMSGTRGEPVFWRTWDRQRILAAGIDEPIRFLDDGPPRLVIRRCVGLGMPRDRLCVGIPFVTSGRSTSFGQIYIDDRPFSPIESLDQFRMEDFHRVETYGYRGERGIRLYTEGYLRLVEAGLVIPHQTLPFPESFDLPCRWADSVFDTSASRRCR